MQMPHPAQTTPFCYSSQIRHRITKSLFRSEHHLLPLILPLLELLLRMLPLILLFPLNRLQLFTLDLPSLLHNLWNMPVALDTFDFGHVGIAFGERFVVFERLALLG